MKNYVAYYRKYADYFKATIPYTAPPTCEEWAIKQSSATASPQLSILVVY